MSTHELRHLKMRLEVDLNVPLCTETRELVAARSLVDLNVQRGGSVPCHIIDLEATDDDNDIVVSSLMEFEEAVNNSRGTRRSSVLIDLDSGLLSRVASNSHSSKRRRASKSQEQISEDLCIDLDGCSKCRRTDVPTMALPPPPPPPPLPTFTCPVCMGPLVEEMSTKCGHIFCKECIKAAISTKRTCPTCRGKISMRNTIRVYLPATD